MLTFFVFSIYFAGILAVGLVAGRRGHADPEEYFLAGRRLPWYAVGLSMIGSNISTEHFIGMIGASYVFGLSAANYDMTAYFAMSLFIFLFLPYYFRKKLYTIPQFLEDRFDSSTRILFAGLTVVHMVLVLLAGALYAGGLIFENLVQGEVASSTDEISSSLLLGILIVAVTTGIYSVYGGLASVVWTDVVQTLILVCAGAYVTAVALIEAGGWDAVWAANQASDTARVHLIQPATDEFAPWPGIMMLFLTLGVWYNCTNQFYVQRCFGARTEWDSRMGIVLAGLIKQFLPLIIVLPGLIAFAIYGEGVPRDQVFLKLLGDYMGPFPEALVLTGMAAAIMSTVSSVLNSSATILTIDVYQRFIKPDADQQRLVLAGRIATAAILIVGTVWAPFIAYFQRGLFVYIQDMASYFAPPIATIFLLGILWRGATTIAANATLLVGIAVGIGLNFGSPYFPEGIREFAAPFLNRAMLNWSVSAVFMVGVSLLTKSPASEAGMRQSELIWRPSYARLPEEERQRFRGWKNFILWWGIVLALRLLVYARYG